ncbi:MAG: glycosyl hydrolase family 32 [Candidatus Hydrogenedentota bacterium]|nr:MAG: glycosyl hydrolase family 32 [Candidatus Hydrogenedentota bacterium]
MNYSPPGYYLWDFWLILEAPQYHLFHLQAPRSLSNPELRHNCATIGHAVASDLRNWRNEGEVLSPGEVGEWDDLSVWTGSVVKSGAVYYMLYTGRCRAEQGTIQRIGLACSDDLYHWEKHPGNPLIEADPEYYEKFGTSDYYWESWRDPYLFYHHDHRCHYALITARARRGELDERGCIAVAKTNDFFHWEILPPLCCPVKFSEMEVPQVFQREGRTYLLFSTNPFWYADSYRGQIDFEPWEGDHYLMADSLFGQYRMVSDGILSRANKHAYASKIVIAPGGTLSLLSWLSRTPGSDEFAGVLSHPMPVLFGADGVPCIAVGSYD